MKGLVAVSLLGGVMSVLAVYGLYGLGEYSRWLSKFILGGTFLAGAALATGIYVLVINKWEQKREK